jgi:hypothetical protein
MTVQLLPTFMDKYLNMGIKDSLNSLCDSAIIRNTKKQKLINIVDEVNTYQTIYKQKLENSEMVKKQLNNLISDYVEQTYNKINVLDADINYFLKGICDSYNERFNIIVNRMDINHIIKMLDYTNNKLEENGTFKILMNMYFKLFGEKILLGLYGKTKKILNEQISENWEGINFEYLLNFSNVLSKLKYYKIDTIEFNLLFQTKFDDISNITKILEFINKNFTLPKETVKNQLIYDINEEIKQEPINRNELKYNLRFLIENLKSNGFLLFEQYYKDIKSRYSEINIDVVNRDLTLTKHMMYIISSFEVTNVNRYVNDMLINIRNYLFDLQESYYNNDVYRKIQIKTESDKYKNEDINKYNRELTNFQIFKYNYINPENILTQVHNLSSQSMDNKTLIFNSINKNLATYLDIYRSFYKTRYPDREIEYDLIDSTIIVKIKFDKTYYIHMALIQYIILDIIMKKDCISVQEIFDIVGIPLSNLNDTFNSLLKIKMIKRNTGSDIKFSLNTDFEFEKNKLSISGLVKKEISETKIAQREFIHDRNMIVLCNLVHYAKKNTYFSRDTIMEELMYKIPFKLNDEYINKAIIKALEDDYIKVQEIPNANGAIDILYQYNDE